MSFILPGWTQQRLAGATVTDLSKLPYEVQRQASFLLDFEKPNPLLRQCHMLIRNFDKPDASSHLTDVRHSSLSSRPHLWRPQ